jgi:hypothetical protein
MLSKALVKVFVQGSRATGARRLLQAREATLFKTADPVLHGPAAVSEQFRHFTARKSGAYQHDPMETVVISRLLGSENFLLYRNPNNVRIFNFEFAHGSLLSARKIAKRSNMRNYLCRYV